jgi:hypothetical protein
LRKLKFKTATNKGLSGIGVKKESSVLVSITASREKDEIVYRVDCAKGLTDEEFEYYLSEIISGICSWKKGICEERLHSFKGAVKKRKTGIPRRIPEKPALLHDE